MSRYRNFLGTLAASCVVAALIVGPVYWNNPYIYNWPSLIIFIILFAFILLTVSFVIKLADELTSIFPKNILSFVSLCLVIMFLIILILNIFSYLYFTTYESGGIYYTVDGHITGSGLLDAIPKALRLSLLTSPAWLIAYYARRQRDRSHDE